MQKTYDDIYPGLQLRLSELQNRNRLYYNSGLFRIISTEDPYSVENPLVEVSMAQTAIASVGTALTGIRDTSGRDVFATTFGQLATSHKDSQITEQFPYGLPGTGVESGITGSGLIETTDSMLRFKTGTADGTAYAESLQALRYIPGSMAYAFFTAVGFNVNDGIPKQIVGIYDEEDGFAIGVINGVMSVLRRRYDGATADDQVVQQSEWNLDTLDGNGPSRLNVDFSKGQIYSITYGYLGYAPIVFSILAPNGNWVHFHRIEYPNTAIETHISQPYLPLRAEVDNTGTGVAVEVAIGSLDVGIYNGGKTDSASRNYGLSGSSILATPKSVSGTDYVVALRSMTTFNGRRNKISTLLNSLSWDTQDSVKDVTLEVIRDPDINVDGTWTEIDSGNSPIEYSIDTDFDLTTGTSTGIGNSLAKDSDLPPLNTGDLTNTLIRRGEILVFKVSSTNGLVGNIFIGLKDLL